MLIPTKHMDLETCTLACAAAVIEILGTQGPQQFDSLLNKVKQKVGEGGRFRFGLGLNFLFLLGLIEYIEGNDTFLLHSQADS